MNAVPDPPPTSEERRLAALHGLRVLDTAPEAVFDRLTEVAALVCDVPISLVSLIDADRQWLKANTGLPGVAETPRDVAFCSRTIEGDGVLEVRDAALDPRFADNPLVTGAPGIRFYAGAPVALPGGERVGALCVIDREPRRLDARQRQILTLLSAAAADALALRRAALALADGERLFRTLSETFPLGVVATDAEGACDYVNDAWQAITGLDAAEAMGFGWARAVHPDDRAMVAEEWRRTAEARGDLDLTFRVLRDDGVLRRVRGVTRPVFAEDGTLVRHVGSVEDVTERVLREEALARSEAILSRASAMTSVGGWEIDLATGALLWSEQTCLIHGLPPDHRPELAAALDFYAPESRPVIEAAMDRATEDGGGWDLELRLVRADGRSIRVRAIGCAERVDGRTVRLLGSLQDVTERVEQREALERAHARISRDVTNLRAIGDELAEQRGLLEATMRSIADAVVTADADGRVSWLNPAAERLTGRGADAVGRPLVEVLRLLDGGTRRPAVDLEALCRGRADDEGSGDGTVLLAASGTEIAVEHSAAPIRGPEGRALGAIVVLRDVSEQRRLAAELAHLAAHDALTGLVNRRAFDARVDAALGRARERGESHALLHVDLDRFKAVNDACGHAAGDRLLADVAEVLRGSVRAGDAVARLGGDEFALLLEGGTEAEAAAVGRDVGERIADLGVVHGDRVFRIGASVGAVPVDDRWASAAALAEAADRCCYEAKRTGRGRTVAWSEVDRRTGAASRTGWAARLHAALETDAFELRARRAVPAGDGRTTGDGRAIGDAPARLEILVALADGADGAAPIPSERFGPPAERVGLAARIDAWTLDRVAARLEGAADLGAIESIAVRLSGQSIVDGPSGRALLERLARTRPEVRARLVLEIDEGAALDALAEAADFARRARALGLGVGLGGVGASARSFDHLRRLGADVLRIDGRLVDAAVHEPLDALTVRGFADAARLLGAVSVADGVDGPEALARARELGVDLALGAAVHRAVAAAELPELAATSGPPRARAA